MSDIINVTDHKERRQKLRNNMPSPEQVLWYYIRKRQILNIRFRRQCSIGKYIVDFYSFEKNLVIEIDGDSHFETDENIKYDKKRTKYLESKGIKIIRFTNNDIATNIEGCVDSLIDYLEKK